MTLTSPYPLQSLQCRTVNLPLPRILSLSPLPWDYNIFLAKCKRSAPGSGGEGVSLTSKRELQTPTRNGKISTAHGLHGQLRPTARTPQGRLAGATPKKGDRDKLIFFYSICCTRVNRLNRVMMLISSFAYDIGVGDKVTLIVSLPNYRLSCFLVAFATNK